MNRPIPDDSIAPPIPCGIKVPLGPVPLIEVVPGSGWVVDRSRAEYYEHDWFRTPAQMIRDFERRWGLDAEE